jgi:hypothetical protein
VLQLLLLLLTQLLLPLTFECLPHAKRSTSGNLL